MTEATESIEENTVEPIPGAKDRKWDAMEPIRTRFRGIIEDIPRLGRLFDQAIVQKEGESIADFDHRRIETLSCMAFMLFQNLKPAGKNVAAFTEFSAAVASAMRYATDGKPVLRPVNSRVREVGVKLNALMEYGEAYCLVMFSDEHVAYYSPVPGEIGAEYFVKAAGCAHKAATRYRSPNQDVVDVLASLFRAAGKGPDESPDGGDGKPA